MELDLERELEFGVEAGGWELEAGKWELGAGSWKAELELGLELDWELGWELGLQPWNSREIQLHPPKIRNLGQNGSSAPFCGLEWPLGVFLESLSKTENVLFAPRQPAIKFAHFHRF